MVHFNDPKFAGTSLVASNIGAVLIDRVISGNIVAVPLGEQATSDDKSGKFLLQTAAQIVLEGQPFTLITMIGDRQIGAPSDHLFVAASAFVKGTEGNNLSGDHTLSDGRDGVQHSALIDKDGVVFAMPDVRDVTQFEFGNTSYALALTDNAIKLVVGVRAGKVRYSNAALLQSGGALNLRAVASMGRLIEVDGEKRAVSILNMRTQPDTVCEQGQFVVLETRRIGANGFKMRIIGTMNMDSGVKVAYGPVTGDPERFAFGAQDGEIQLTLTRVVLAEMIAAEKLSAQPQPQPQQHIGF